MYISLLGCIVIHLARICLASHSPSIRHHILSFRTYFYIRLDCTFLCATQFSPQFHAMKTESQLF